MSTLDGKQIDRSFEYILAAVRYAEADYQLKWEIEYGGLIANSTSKEHSAAWKAFKTEKEKENEPQ